MQRHPYILEAGSEESECGIYDPEPIQDDDLWFMPASFSGEADDLAPPLPRADHSRLIDVDAWREAEASLAVSLAKVAAKLGALDERLRRAPEGWRHRLALIEASGVSWLGTERISAERLSLWRAMRLSGVQEDNQALARADWACRRLTAGPMPDVTSAESVMDFLGRQEPAEVDHILHPSGEPIGDQLAAWCEEMNRAGDLHPISRAAFGQYLWGPTGLLAHVPGAEMEAAVLSARIATDGLTGGAVFLPLAGGGLSGLRRVGNPAERLRRFLKGAEAAILATLRHLDQLEAWQGRASHALKGRSGRTPKRMVEVLSEWPLVSAPMAEEITGASRAALQRNLNDMAQMGLIREITGQGRYRVWCALV
ncbi:helix-turn-helix domain-containing protein [Hoeflea sp. EC-HK425]|jgi:hypothetical protein|uniref:helix-turn-helix domain-containing protein n=1 Tax=Hoeflea sp. EC-HK425 TaxID=2038388 RepID=UPI0012528835|nr:helix-turn-helix domain-containing protein [Hoeflea sp. EC-HK425]VVS96079.1 conserved hypothetical protein [Hoeflea sp. EC-HK425]